MTHLDHAPDVVSMRVRLGTRPDGNANRIVLYDWFTRVGRPPRSGNAVEILVDGADAWARVRDDLVAAQQEVQIATWLCRPDHELVRGDEVTEPEARASSRFGAIVEALGARGVRTRLLIWGVVYTPILDPWLFRWYWCSGKWIDVVEQDHPRLIGSFHQKTITVDGRVAYCGGMNLKENDWDCSEHRVFDHRRTPYRARAKLRQRIVDKLVRTKFPPRHDLMVRLEGPVVHDVIVNFRSRWNRAQRVARRWFVGRIAPYVRTRWLGQPRIGRLPAPPRDQRPTPAGDRFVQVVRTMPGGENGILDAYRRAIRNARRYVYIENQYFRSPLIAEELRLAIAKNPKLRVAVVVIPINDGKETLLDPSGYWTAHTQDAIRTVRPGFQLTRTMSFDRDARGNPHYVQIDVHAKVMIIDDVWVTVGSANINDRGFQYEAEINVVVLDARDGRALRLRLMGEHLGVAPSQQEEVLGDVDAAFDLWESHAEENVRRRARGDAPLSHVHHFVQRARKRPWIKVGAGIF